MTDQEQARDHAARELARRLEHVTSLADPLAFARDYWADATAHGWYWRDPPPPANPPDPDAAHRGAELARDLLARKTSIRLPRKDDRA